MPPKSTPEMLAFRRRLARWFRRQGRDLPWRRTRDPYRVLVSEVMLQQTQVTRVEEYYSRFLARYPTIHALAAAKPAQVRDAWQGLGYYRRAVHLHRLARTVVTEYAGAVPAGLDALRSLPGIGRYTAGAVATFAFERSTPAVDTNVSRVIRRVFLSDRAALGSRRRPGREGVLQGDRAALGSRRRPGREEVLQGDRAALGSRRRPGREGVLEGDRAALGSRRRPGREEGSASEREVWAIAERLVPRAGAAAWTFNQAIMELGALVCTARIARCEVCPVRGVCGTGRAKGEGRGARRPGGLAGGAQALVEGAQPGTG